MFLQQENSLIYNPSLSLSPSISFFHRSSDSSFAEEESTIARKIRKSQAETRCKCNGSWLVVKASGGANRPIYGSRNEKASRDEVASKKPARERERERNERFISRKRENLGISLLPLFHPSPPPFPPPRLASLPYYHRPPTTCIINGGLRVQWDEKQPWVILPRKILLALTCTAVETSAGPPPRYFLIYLAFPPPILRTVRTYVPFPMPFDPTFRLSESIVIYIYSSIVIRAYTYICVCI